MTKLLKISDTEYFKSEGISNSFLNAFERSPAHCFTEKKSTPDMAFGSLLHLYILQNDVFLKDYLIVPDNLKLNADGSLNKIDKQNKEWIESIPKDKNYISGQIYQKLQKISEKISLKLYNNNYLGHYIKNGQNEIAIFFDYLDIQCKVKIDLLYNSLGQYFIFDLKKTDDCLSFQKSVNNYKYYRQAFFYQKAVEKLTGEIAPFIFITAEDSEPYGVKLYELETDYFILAEKEITKIIEKYKKWVEKGSDKAECYDNEIIKLNKPNWMGE